VSHRCREATIAPRVVLLMWGYASGIFTAGCRRFTAHLAVLPRPPRLLGPGPHRAQNVSRPHDTAAPARTARAPGHMASTGEGPGREFLRNFLVRASRHTPTSTHVRNILGYQRPWSRDQPVTPTPPPTNPPLLRGAHVTSRKQTRALLPGPPAPAGSCSNERGNLSSSNVTQPYHTCTCMDWNAT